MRYGEEILCGIVAAIAFALFLPPLELYERLLSAAILGLCAGMIVASVREILRDEDER